MDDTSSSSASPSGDSDPQQDARQRLRRQRASELVMNAWQNCYLKIRTYSQSGPKRKLANWARVVVVRTTIALTILCLIILLWQPHSRAHAFLPEQRFDTEGQLADGLRRWDEDFARSVVPISCSDKDHALPYPLFSALAAGCTGVEVDVWLTEDDDLAVEQNVSEFHPSRTLRTLYLQPLLEILSRENPDEQWANHTVYDRARGVFHTHPNTTLTILINVKTDPQKTWKVVNAQLEALRAKQFLARFHVIHTAPGFQEKQDMWPGPVTIVGTGNMDRNAYYEYGTSRPNIQVDGYSISEHYEYHDYFYDAPLDMIPYGNLFTQGVINGQSWTGSTQLYHADEAYYASTSFKKAIGSVRLGFSQKQLNAVREQIYIAKKSGLKSRYYDLPSWPTNYRDYIWDILTKEGVDMLTVDDLESVAKRGWSIGYTRSIVWMTLVSVWLFSMSVIALWVVSRMFRTYFHAVSVSPMLLKPRNFAILQHSISTWNDLKKSDNMVFSDWIDTIIASFALWSTKCILFQYRYYYPLHLLLAQLLAACSILIGEALHKDQTTVSLRYVKLVTGRGRVLTGASIITLSFTLPSFSQALLHTPNFTTLVMVLSLAALADSIRNSPLLALLKVFALSIVAMGAVVLLYDEHRLTIEGLLFGMAAIIGIFLSKALIQSCEQANITAIELNRNPAHGSHRSIIYTAILTSLVIVGFWALYCESTASAIKALTLINPLLLLLNVSLVACTLTKGLCSHSFFSIERKQKTNFGWTNAHIFLFAGLCALMNQTFPIPFVSSTVQIGCFSAPFCFLFFLTQTSCGRHLDEMEIEQSSEHRSSTTVIHLRDEVEVHNQSAELDTLISPNGIAPHMVTSDISTLQEENFTNRHWRLHSQRIVSKALTSAIIAVVLGVWIAFGFLNYHRLGRPLEIRSVPIIDSTYQSQTELDIVINMYDEEPASVMKMLLDLKKLPTIQYRSTRVFIYYKGESEPIFDLPHHLGAVHLFPRPNVGREGETYLYHILSQRNNLATHTLFLQSHIHNTWEMHRRIDQYFVPSTGMLSLGFSGHTCDCDNCFDRWGWHDDRFQSLYTQIYNKTCSTALLSYKGQFIASARRLRGIDPAIYQHLSDALVYTESWAHRETYLEGQPDVMSAPFFGFTLERMWSLLLQCSEMDIALKCPTLLSGKRTEGDVSDCQCLDPL